VYFPYQTPTFRQGEDDVALAPDGSFRLQGIAAGRYQFSLVAPALGRRGEPLPVGVTPLRVRDADLVREFDVAEDLPGVITGRVDIVGQRIAMSRLLVHSVAGAQQQQRPVGYNVASFRCI